MCEYVALRIAFSCQPVADVTTVDSQGEYPQLVIIMYTIQTVQLNNWTINHDPEKDSSYKNNNDVPKTLEKKDPN